MSDWAPIVVALIACIGSIAGVVITNNSANSKMNAKLEQTQAVFEAHVSEKIDRLTEKVEAHNQLIERTYKLEATAKLHAQRLDTLEKGGKNG